MYLIIPPSETTPEIYNGPNDPIGNGAQGWHNEGVTNPGPPPTYYWAIVKTNDCGPPSGGLTFVNNFSQKVAHELAEQFVDRNGTFKEVGDPCLNDSETYRGWQIQKYWSDWDNRCIDGDQPPLMPRSFQTLDDYQHIFAPGTDGNLWLEQPPFGNPPPARKQVDGNVFTFQALDNQTVLSLGTDGNLWLEHGPFGTVPPNREQVDGSVQAFQGLDAQTVFVQGLDGNLWLENGPFGKVPPPRVQIDGNVKGFAAVDENHVFVLGTDSRLWLEEGPFGHVPPNRQLVATDVRGFLAQAVWAWVWVLDNEGNLWLDTTARSPERLPDDPGWLGRGARPRLAEISRQGFAMKTRCWTCKAVGPAGPRLIRPSARPAGTSILAPHGQQLGQQARGYLSPMTAS